MNLLPYNFLLHTHSGLRYLVLLMLLIVITKSLFGLIANKPFVKLDNTLSLVLLIVTHLQLLAGLTLYFVSPFVKFDSTTMSDRWARYWTVEHAFGMILAVILITVARSTSKKIAGDAGKFKRLTYLNILALLVIIVTILVSKRGLVG